MKPLSFKARIIVVSAAFFLTAAELLGAEPQSNLNPHLEALRPLLGKTWRGVFENSKPEKPTVDVARWERTLNGQAARMIHSINNGVYGGETLFVWNEKNQTVEYYYFTTAGFMTTGTMQIKGNRIETHEQVKGSTDGITEVRATSEIRGDGTFHVKAEYFKKGEWTLGHEATYREDPSAQVVFN